LNASDLLGLTLPLGAGIILGMFYFWGLWLTVQKLPRARRPMLLSLSSFFVRLAVVLAGFYFVMSGRWERLLVCLVGFLCVRFAAVRLWGPGKCDHGPSATYINPNAARLKDAADPRRQG
jgi:F1F0 ATPase subunit 2